jgi:eukaryotic-like serine/threonine-protein kinase
MPPKVIGPYRILETLGSGGVGTVFRAVDRRTQESAAIKLLTGGPALDARSALRLAREFETLQQLSHPNVVKVYSAGVFQGYPYLVMELIEGLTLKHYLSLEDDALGSDEGLLRAIAAHQRSLTVPPTESAALDISLDDDGDEGSTPAFGLESFAEESPSEEYSDSSDEGIDERGPAAMRALAAFLDEPETNDEASDSFTSPLDLPFEVPQREERPTLHRPTAEELNKLNRPERVGRLHDVVLQLCESLAYIHGHGLIHRDLKPSNVMVDEERVVRLMDFGLAKYLADDAAVTADGRLVGTFRYMAPEQILGERLDARTDLYSLGVILYELLCGRPPFEAKTPYELWQKVLETEPVPIGALNAKADRTLVRVCQRLMRKEPDDRFHTAEEVHEAVS